jgi:hypothetical protein
MIKSHIIDPSTGIGAVVDHGSTDHEPHGLVVATRPLKSYKNEIKFFTSDVYGTDMNQNAAAGGTPDKIHDGIDSSLWTASDIVGGGKTTFNSSDRSYEDDQSIKVDNSPVNDVFQLAKGSDVNCSNYVSLTMWINVDKDWKNGDSISIYGWDTDTNTQVGTTAYLQDYFSWNTFDTWHQILIPLTDFGDLYASTILDAFRIRIIAAEAKSPKFYLDTIQLEQTGTPIKFSIQPNLGTWLHIYSYTISFADAYDSTLGNASMPKIPYDSFLDVSLTSGIIYRRVISNKTIFSVNILNLLDFLQLPNTSITGSGSDGTNTWVTLEAVHTEPLLLKGEDEDEISFLVTDNLSGLLRLRISAGCKLEYRNGSLG